MLLDGASWLVRRKYVASHPLSIVPHESDNKVRPGWVDTARAYELPSSFSSMVQLLRVWKYLLSPRRKWKLTPYLRTMCGLCIYSFNSICQVLADVSTACVFPCSYAVR
jgi:hypothetical protein